MWRLEKILLPSSVYEKLDSDKSFEQYIIEKHGDAWGRSKGGIHSGGGRRNSKAITIPPHSTDLAEFMGVMLGDGCSYWNNKHKVRNIRIVGHAEESEYYDGFLSPLCERLFNIKPAIMYRKTSKAIVLSIANKKIVDFLEIQGFPPGNKVRRQAAIPSWIFSDKEFMRACLRGLVDTDGSIYMMGKWIQVCFSNRSRPLLTGFQFLCSELGIFVSNISGHQVYISRKRDIEKYIKEVGFHNSKHYRRYCRFTHSPVF
jgi:intein/homing endonuclease